MSLQTIQLFSTGTWGSRHNLRSNADLNAGSSGGLPPLHPTSYPPQNTAIFSRRASTSVASYKPKTPKSQSPSKLLRLVSDWPKNIEPIMTIYSHPDRMAERPTHSPCQWSNISVDFCGPWCAMIREISSVFNFFLPPFRERRFAARDYFYCESLCFQYLLNYTGTLTST